MKFRFSSSGLYLFILIILFAVLPYLASYYSLPIFDDLHFYEIDRMGFKHSQVLSQIGSGRYFGGFILGILNSIRSPDDLNSIRIFGAVCLALSAYRNVEC